MSKTTVLDGEETEGAGPTNDYSLRTAPALSTFYAMVATALLLRLITMAFLYPEQLDSRENHFRFGFETGRIASSIASGRGFANPLSEGSGPTAWMTPVYPYIVAGFFRLFGIYTKAAALAILSFNALTSALTCIPIFLFARKSFGERVAIWAGWTWAFFPYGIYFPVERIWETWLATLLLCVLFQIVLELEHTDRLVAWIGTGLLWGLAGLTSAVAVAVMPFLHVWVTYRRQLQKRSWILPNVACALVILASLAPWFVRNYRVFHRFVPFRDSMGLVLRLGTKGSSDYWGPYELGPWGSTAERQEFQERGEIQYMDHKAQQAFIFIKSHPRWYAWTSIRRMVFMWTGYWSLEPEYLKQEEMDPYNIPFCCCLTFLAALGLRKAFRRQVPQALPYLIMIAVFPSIYYFTSPEFYYRRPLDPFLVVLAVYALVREDGIEESVVTGA